MMKKYLYVLGIAFVTNVCCGTIFAEPVSDAHTQVELVTDVSSIQPGQPFWVGLHMDMDDEWQTYWKNPGDSGLATVIEWDLPEGFKANEIRWPFPVRLDYPELTSYGYEDEVLLLSEITPPEGLKQGGQQTIKAHVTWLACGDICVPGKADLSLKISVKSEEPDIDESIREMFIDVRKKWPSPVSVWNVGVYDAGDSFRFHLIPPDGEALALKNAAFFPERNDLIDHKAKQIFSEMKGSFQLMIPKSAIVYQNATQLKGVLVFQEMQQVNLSSMAIDEPINFEDITQ